MLDQDTKLFIIKTISKSNCIEGCISQIRAIYNPQIIKAFTPDNQHILLAFFSNVNGTNFNHVGRLQCKKK